MYIVFPYQSVVDLYNLALSSIPGVNLSLLSRVMSSRLSRGTYNGGLLSTEAGTLARVVADATITLAGYVHQSMLLNVTLLPSLFICVTSILATCFTYNSLYWFLSEVEIEMKRGECSSAKPQSLHHLALHSFLYSIFFINKVFNGSIKFEK